MMRIRLRGGVLAKAKRGELKVPLPVGLVYDPLGQVVLDPDEQVQHSLRLIFDTFARTGSASATVRHFNNEKLLFPYRPQGGPHSGELHWKPLRFARAGASAQPAIRRRFRVRAQPQPAPSRRRYRDQKRSARGMDGAAARCPPGLHHLGALRAE